MLVELDKASYAMRGGTDLEPLPAKLSKKRKLELDNDLQYKRNVGRTNDNISITDVTISQVPNAENLGPV